MWCVGEAQDPQVIIIIIIYFWNVYFFHAQLGLDIFPDMRPIHIFMNTAHSGCKPSSSISSFTHSLQVLPAPTLKISPPPLPHFYRPTPMPKYCMTFVLSKFTLRPFASILVIFHFLNSSINNSWLFLPCKMRSSSSQGRMFCPLVFILILFHYRITKMIAFDCFKYAKGNFVVNSLGSQSIF